MTNEKGHGKKLILIIDDDADIGTSLSEILESDGYRVITAKNGLEGLQIAKAEQPNVILLDVMMPVLDGYGFLEAQREDATIYDIPVIVLSAGSRLDQIPPEIPRLPKPPELLALFSLIESRVNFVRSPLPTHLSA